MFSAVQGASVNGGGIYFKAGRYKVEILAVKSILSRKNENLFVVETEIKESDCADLRPNTKCSQVINLSKHDSAPGNIKAFVAAALDISPTSEEVNWEELCDVVCTDANPLKGTMMTLICANTKTKAGGDFTLHQWSLLSAPSGALPTATAPLATPPAAPRAAAPTPPAASRPAAPLPPPVAKPWPVGFVAHPNSPGWLWNPQTNEVIAQP
jgi:hypothetical protein